MKIFTGNYITKTIMLSVLTLQGVLTGCSTQPHTAEERMLQAQEKTVQVNTELMDEMPSWYRSPPEADEIYIYQVGYGVSSELSMAEDKASLHIHSKLAEQLSGKTDSSKTMVSSDQSNVYGDNTANLSARSVMRITVFDQKTPFETIDKKIMFEDGRFIVFQLGRFDKLNYRKEQAAADKKQSEFAAAQHGINHYQQGIEELNQLKKSAREEPGTQ
jgi:hypothetical protein